MLADRSALRHRRDDVAPKVLRVRAREADPLDPSDGVDCAQELGEARADVAAVRVDVLAEQRHLAHAVRCEPLDLRDDLARTPGDLAPAHGGDDAVGADRVAAHRDLHPGLEATLALRTGSPAAKARSSTGAERAAGDPLAARAEPVAEVRDRARPERDVDVRIEREQPLALCLRVAAADGDDRAGPVALQLGRVPHVGGEAGVGLLADRARVEDEDVRLAPARAPRRARAPRAGP